MNIILKTLLSENTALEWFLQRLGGSCDAMRIMGRRNSTILLGRGPGPFIPPPSARMLLEAVLLESAPQFSLRRPRSMYHLGGTGASRSTFQCREGCQIESRHTCTAAACWAKVGGSGEKGEQTLPKTVRSRILHSGWWNSQINADTMESLAQSGGHPTDSSGDASP